MQILSPSKLQMLREFQGSTENEIDWDDNDSDFLELVGEGYVQI